jgi:osmoprotectant transport system substrate-binding protein
MQAKQEHWRLAIMRNPRPRREESTRRGLRLSIALPTIVAAIVGAAGCGSSGSSGASSSSGASTRAPVVSTAATGGPGHDAPAITIGDKNFPEQNILGELYAQALRAKGFTVHLKSNIGSSEIIYKAFKAGQIDMYPEYTGVFLSAVAGQTKTPSSAVLAYTQAKSYAEKHGFTMLNYTPFYDSNALAAMPAYADEHKLSSIGDLKALGKRVVLGGPPEFATRFEGLDGLKQEYGVAPTFKPIAIELTYKALEGNQVDVQNVFTTDGQLLTGKFKLLSDPKHVFGFQNVAPIVRPSTVTKEGAAFQVTINIVSKLLTIKAMQQMNKAVTIDKQSPDAVAAQFLRANGLI